MARIEYQQGIECKCCGEIVYRVEDINRLCQKCGAEIVDEFSWKDGVTLGKDGQGIVVKITHKLFSEKYVKVRNI